MRFNSLILVTTLITTVLTGPISLIQDAGTNAMRLVLSKFMNESTIDRVMAKEVLEPHPYSLDLTDDNWQVALRTGGYDDPFAKALEDIVWVITVYGPDPVSKMLLKASDEVARFNSSASGGELPKEMRFARLDYSTQTVLPTLFWLWKVPIMVIATKDLKDLRFFKIPQIAPFQYQMSMLLSNRTLWETMPIWEGPLAPGGELSTYLFKLANGWSKFHQYMSKIPTFVILIISGALMNIVVAWFHKNDEIPTASTTTPPVFVSRDDRRAELKRQEKEGKNPVVALDPKIGVDSTSSLKVDDSTVKKRK